MKTKLGIVIAVLLVVIVVGGWLFSNRSQSEGELSLAGLTGKVTVFRDEKGMAYLYAQTLDDALLAQGFITAQDRLFQMELTRLFSSGRLSEMAGKEGKVFGFMG